MDGKNYKRKIVSLIIFFVLVFICITRANAITNIPLTKFDNVTLQSIENIRLDNLASEFESATKMAEAKAVFKTTRTVSGVPEIKYIARNVKIPTANMFASMEPYVNAAGWIVSSLVKNPYAKAVLAVAQITQSYTEDLAITGEKKAYYPVEEITVTKTNIANILDSIPQCETKRYEYSYLQHGSFNQDLGRPNCDWYDTSRTGDIPYDVCAYGDYGVRTKPGITVANAAGQPVEVLSKVNVKYPADASPMVTGDHYCADIIPSYRGLKPTEAAPANRYRMSDLTDAQARIQVKSKPKTEEEVKTLLADIKQNVFNPALQANTLTTLFKDLVDPEQSLANNPVTDEEYKTAETDIEKIAEIKPKELDSGTLTASDIGSEVAKKVDDNLTDYEPDNNDNCIDECLDKIRNSHLVNAIDAIKGLFVGSEVCPEIPWNIHLPTADEDNSGVITGHCDVLTDDNITMFIRGFFLVFFTMMGIFIVLGA